MLPLRHGHYFEALPAPLLSPPGALRLYADIHYATISTPHYELRLPPLSQPAAARYRTREWQ